VAERFHIRFCFSDTVTADAFSNRFGGQCLTYAQGKPKPQTSATSSDASAVKREAEEDWGSRGRRWRRRLELTSHSALIRGLPTARASWSTSPAWRTISRARHVPRRMSTLARHSHHPTVGRASDRRQPTPARGVESIKSTTFEEVKKAPALPGLHHYKWLSKKCRFGPNCFATCRPSPGRSLDVHSLTQSPPLLIAQ
jgi:hypothetical protein